MNESVKEEVYFDCSDVPFCHACLSTDRNLLVLTDYRDVFYKICNDQDKDHSTIIQMCWECIALLKKVKKFSRKVSEVQKILQCCLKNKKFLPRSLTYLKICQVNTEPITLEHKEREAKQIKEEMDFDDDPDRSNCSYKDEIEQKPESPKAKTVSAEKILETKNNETVKSARLSSETKRNSRKIIKKRQISQYRRIITSLRKHRQVPVDECELPPALGAKRNQAKFSNAKHKSVDCVETLNNETAFKKKSQTHNDENVALSATAAADAKEGTNNRNPKAYRKCVKCGATTPQDLSVPFHLFPKLSTINVLRVTAWATFCWPDDDWSSTESLKALHETTKFVCGRHFQQSCYIISSKSTRLSTHAVPGTKDYINKLLHSLRTKIPEMKKAPCSLRSQNRRV